MVCWMAKLPNIAHSIKVSLQQTVWMCLRLLMAVSVLEYLGQRADVVSPVIVPLANKSRHKCPFAGFDCPKLLKKPFQPICSVKKASGKSWIVCPERLCSTSKTRKDVNNVVQPVVLVDSQKAFLHSIARVVWGDTVERSEVLIDRERQIGRSHADYVMMLDSDRLSPRGATRVVVEMQGGGETSSTGAISRNVEAWARDSNRTNADLSKVVNAGTIETNAWRRQQEQFFMKGNIALQTHKDCGIVFCVGESIYDLLMSKVEHAGLRELKDFSWSLALVCVDSNSDAAAPDLKFDIHQTKQFFTNYHAFVRALTDQGAPSVDTFSGEFDRLSGGTANISI